MLLPLKLILQLHLNATIIFTMCERNTNNPGCLIFLTVCLYFNTFAIQQNNINSALGQKKRCYDSCNSVEKYRVGSNTLIVS
jgi:hypothetical protein